MAQVFVRSSKIVCSAILQSLDTPVLLVNKCNLRLIINRYQKYTPRLLPLSLTISARFLPAAPPQQTRSSCELSTSLRSLVILKMIAVTSGLLTYCTTGKPSDEIIGIVRDAYKSRNSSLRMLFPVLPYLPRVRVFILSFALYLTPVSV